MQRIELIESAKPYFVPIKLTVSQLLTCVSDELCLCWTKLWLAIKFEMVASFSITNTSRK